MPLYRTIVVDPPWYERGAGKCKRGADKHYPLIKTISEIQQVILDSGLWTPDPTGCHFYLWVTNNHLPDGLALMRLLGFVYKTNLCWAKPNYGLGRYFRGQHELCLFGTVGAFIATSARTFSTLIHAPKRKHSEKPIEVMSMIEHASLPPRVELFAACPRAGWTTWGKMEGRLEGVVLGEGT